MIKKISRYLLLVICCFIGTVSVSAREVSERELAELIHELRPEANYVYIVGEYVFSSNHKFTREDNLLATRSIKIDKDDGEIAGKPIYDKMTIYRYTFEMNEDFEQDLDSFKWDANMTGKTPHPDKFNIRYIDYIWIPDISKAEINEMDEDAYKELKDKIGVEFRNDDNLTQKKVDDKNFVLTGDVYRNDIIDEKVLPKEDLTGFYYSFVVKVDNLTADSVVTVNGKKYGKSDFNEKGEMVVLMPLNPDNEEQEKKIIVTVDLDGKKGDYTETSYTIDYHEVKFKKRLDVNEALNDAMNDVASDKFTANLTDGTLSLEQKDVLEPLNKGVGKGMIDALTEMINTDGVDTIKLTYNGKDYVLNKDNIESEVSKLLSDVAGKDYDKAIQNDVIGKSIKMTVELEDGNVTTVTPDGKSSVEYTIDFTGKKAKETKFNVSVDKKDSSYTDEVMKWLNDVNFNGVDTDLALENGKLKGTILINEKVGSDFSSLPEDITGYYYTYVVRLADGEVKDSTTITLPGNGGTKVVGKDAFDTMNSIVVMHALNPNKENKTFEIIVDYDGDGQEYLPTTYVIDYSEVEFLTAEDMLKLSSDNVEKYEKLKSQTIEEIKNKQGEEQIITISSIMDTITQVMYEETTISDGVDSITMYGYIAEKNGMLYSYESYDKIDWEYTVAKTSTSEDSLFETLFKGYKSIKRVDALEDGTIRLEVRISIGGFPLGPDENGNEIILNPVNDEIMYVTIKDKKMTKIESNILSIFGEDVQNTMEKWTETVTIEEYDGTVTVPQEVIDNATEKE